MLDQAMKMMELMSGNDNVELSNDELRLILAGLGELPTKMSINLFLKLDAILKARHDARNQPEPDQSESEEDNGD